MKRYITSSGSASMGVSTVFDTGKESLRNKFLKPFESKCQYYIVLFELFSLYEKVPSVLSFRSSNFFIALHSHRSKWLKLTAAELKKAADLLQRQKETPTTTAHMLLTFEALLYGTIFLLKLNPANQFSNLNLKLKIWEWLCDCGCLVCR